MWLKGSFVIDGVKFLYEAKVYNEGSVLGINNGRISKLVIVRDIGEGSWSWNNTIINYDRGWDICPKNDLDNKALQYVLNLFL